MNAEVVWAAALLASALTVGCDSEQATSKKGVGGGGGSPAGQMLQWEAPTTNVDGSPLTDLVGYRLYRGVAPGAYTDSQDLGLASCTAPTTGPPTCSYPLTDLPSGDHYLAVTAYDTDGYESLFSNETLVSLP